MFNWKQLHSLYYESMILTIAKERETLHYDSHHGTLLIVR